MTDLLLEKIQAVGESVVRGFNIKSRKKHVWDSGFKRTLVYFIILILIFYILAINKKQIWSPEADTRTLDYS